jgi:hypothetical protein
VAVYLGAITWVDVGAAPLLQTALLLFPYTNSLRSYYTSSLRCKELTFKYHLTRYDICERHSSLISNLKAAFNLHHGSGLAPVNRGSAWWTRLTP